MALFNSVNLFDTEYALGVVPTSMVEGDFQVRFHCLVEKPTRETAGRTVLADSLELSLGPEDAKAPQSKKRELGWSPHSKSQGR